MGYANRADVVVLGLARGGVPVAAEVARALRAPLDVFVVRKLGFPGHEEFAIGAITSAGIRVVNRPLIAELGLTSAEVEAIVDREMSELERREIVYRAGRLPIEVQGRTVVVVDDGLATGASMIAAVKALLLKRPQRIVVATPVASREAMTSLERLADEVVAVKVPEQFVAVGEWYEDFNQTTDAEVRWLLSRTGYARRAVQIRSHGVTLQADLTVPADPLGIVIFAHGSGSGRHSERNRFVASALNDAAIGTLLLDLLTEEEASKDRHTGRIRFEVQLLAERLRDAAAWVRAQPGLAKLPLAYFGASTGAGAALIAAADDLDIRAVVSRGGRPDLAESALARVRAPTLLIVGGYDSDVLDLNRKAMRAMRCAVELIIVPRATHLFEERGALEQVAVTARDWLSRRLSADAKTTYSYDMSRDQASTVP